MLKVIIQLVVNVRKELIKIEFNIPIPVPEFLLIRKWYGKWCNFKHHVYLSKFWCKYKPHLWRTWNFTEISPHWRLCRRCGKRELDHNDWGEIQDWQPTNYSTPEWDAV